MAKTPEGDVKKRVKALLETYKPNIWHNWPVPAGFGIPMLDCVGCFYGKFFAIETKRAGERLTPRQEFTVEEMEASGAKVFIVMPRNDEDDPDTWFGWNELEMWLMAVKADAGSR